jgi:hypothetical protein
MHKNGIAVFMGLYEDVMARLEEFLEGHGTKAVISRDIGTANNTLSRWFPKKKNAQKREPSGRMLMAALEALGAQVIFPDDKREELCATPEAAAIDRLIKAMRESGEADDSTIQAAVLSRVENNLFQKIAKAEMPKKRKRAI